MQQKETFFFFMRFCTFCTKTRKSEIKGVHIIRLNLWCPVTVWCLKSKNCTFGVGCRVVVKTTLHILYPFTQFCDISLFLKNNASGDLGLSLNEVFYAVFILFPSITSVFLTYFYCTNSWKIRF
jgi:hypothetical protein